MSSKQVPMYLKSQCQQGSPVLKTRGSSRGLETSCCQVILAQYHVRPWQLWEPAWSLSPKWKLERKNGQASWRQMSLGWSISPPTFEITYFLFTFFPQLIVFSFFFILCLNTLIRAESLYVAFVADEMLGLNKDVVLCHGLDWCHPLLRRLMRSSIPLILYWHGLHGLQLVKLYIHGEVSFFPLGYFSLKSESIC